MAMDLKTYIDLERGRARRIAKSVGVSAASVSDWANGKKQPSYGNIRKICEATGWDVTPHELLPNVFPNPTDAIPVGIGTSPSKGAAE